MPDKSRNKPLTFSSLFNKNSSELGKLCQHGAFLVNLERKLLSFLPPPLNTHCKVANYANDTIILHSESSAWATKLRYNTPAILDYLRKECHLDALKTIRIKVNPVASIKQPTPARRLTLSPSSAVFITQVANTIVDEDLRLSLLKIAKHKNNKPV